MTESARIWTEAAAQAADKAKSLRWLVLTIFVVCVSLVYVNGYLGPILIPIGRRIAGPKSSPTPRTSPRGRASTRRSSISRR